MSSFQVTIAQWDLPSLRAARRAKVSPMRDNGYACLARQASTVSVRPCPIPSRVLRSTIALSVRICRRSVDEPDFHLPNWGQS